MPLLLVLNWLWEKRDVFFVLLFFAWFFWGAKNAIEDATEKALNVTIVPLLREVSDKLGGISDTMDDKLDRISDKLDDDDPDSDCISNKLDRLHAISYQLSDIKNKLDALKDYSDNAKGT